MNNITKNQQACDEICKKSCRLQTHDRGLQRICPSKLSKHELENLYFALLDSTLELKKTIHSQQDKIKILSTKLQRMTVIQRNAAGKEKDCCNSKVLVNEQKEIIVDLKKANEQMSDRLRLLNMRLCSAKQFLRQSSALSGKCPRCGACPGPLKNPSLSAIGPKTSRMSNKMTAASCQNIAIDASEVPKSTQDVETETDQNEKKASVVPKLIRDVETETDLNDNEGTEKQCNETKSKPVMDELKQKIVNLQEELSKTHDEYSKRISKLENDVSGLHKENMQVKSSKAVSEHALQQKVKKADDLREKLRETEGKVNDLRMQLSIEKRKVKELETTIKIVKTSSQSVKMMEKLNAPKGKPASAINASTSAQPTAIDASTSPAIEVSGSVTSYYSVKQDDSALAETPDGYKSNLLSPTSRNIKEDGPFPISDDSGCTDLSKSIDAGNSKPGQSTTAKTDTSSDLEKHQADPNAVVETGQSATPIKETSSDLGTYEYDDDMQMAVITITNPKSDVETQELGTKDSKPEKDIVTSTPIKDCERANVLTPAAPANVTSWNELVQNMAKISSETDDFGTTTKRLSVDKTNPSQPKGVDDYKNQIPGPIPTTSQSYNDKKKQLKKKKSTSVDKINKDPVDLVDQKESLAEKSVKIDSSDNDITDNRISDKAKSDLESDGIKLVINESPTKVQNPKIQIVDPKDAPAMSDDKKATEDLKRLYSETYTVSHRVSILSPKKTRLDEEITTAEELTKKFPTKAKQETPSAEELTKPKQDTFSAEELQLAAAAAKNDSFASYVYGRDVIETPLQQMGPRSSKEKLKSAQTNLTESERMDGIIDDFAAQWPPPTEPPPTVPSSTMPPQTALPVGAQTVPPAEDVGATTAPQSASQHDFATLTAKATRRDSGTYTARAHARAARRDSATYTKPGDECACERATSPDNTERDVSSLSDLPPEKNDKSPLASPLSTPRDARSPGEDKATTTYSDSDTRTNDYGLLSDGELPTNATLNRTRKLSFGERPTYAPEVPQNSEVKMEETLNAIAEELAHCRRLLAAARDHEVRRETTA